MRRLAVYPDPDEIVLGFSLNLQSRCCRPFIDGSSHRRHCVAKSFHMLFEDGELGGVHLSAKHGITLDIAINLLHRGAIAEDDPVLQVPKESPIREICRAYDGKIVSCDVDV